MEWTSISKEELSALVQIQLSGCDSGLLDLFHEIEVPLRQCSICRFGRVEAVFVVAEAGNEVTYYEDVEEGFELCELGIDGMIPERGCEQLELGHVLARLHSNKKLQPTSVLADL